MCIHDEELDTALRQIGWGSNEGTADETDSDAVFALLAARQLLPGGSLLAAAKKMLDWCQLRGFANNATCELTVAVRHEADERRDFETLLKKVYDCKWEDAENAAGNILWRRDAIKKKYGP